MGRIYLLLEPNLMSYDKVMTEEALKDFAYELGFEEDKRLIEHYTEERKINSLIRLLYMIMESNGYIVKQFNDGVFRLEDYRGLLEEYCSDREDVKELI